MSKYLDELIEKHLAEINKLSDEEVKVLFEIEYGEINLCSVVEDVSLHPN